MSGAGNTFFYVVANEYVSLCLCLKAKGGAAASSETHGCFLASDVLCAVLPGSGCVPPQH